MSLVYIVSARGPYAEKAAGFAFDPYAEGAMGSVFHLDAEEAQKRADELSEELAPARFRVYPMTLEGVEEMTLEEKIKTAVRLLEEARDEAKLKDDPDADYDPERDWGRVVGLLGSAHAAAVLVEIPRDTSIDSRLVAALNRRDYTSGDWFTMVHDNHPLVREIEHEIGAQFNDEGVAQNSELSRCKQTLEHAVWLLNKEAEEEGFTARWTVEKIESHRLFEEDVRKGVPIREAIIKRQERDKQ